MLSETHLNLQTTLQTTSSNFQVDQTSERRTLRTMKENVPKHLKRGVNEKEIDSLTKRVLRIPLEKPFEEAYFTHRLWMFFRETKETEQDIHSIFNQIREKMTQRITLKKKSDPGKFEVPCFVKGIEFPCALCDTCSSVNILPKVMVDHLGLKIEPSEDSFTFVDHSTRNSGGIIRDLEVQIGNALVPVDFHVLENKQNKNHSLLLRRAFMATLGAVCSMQTNQLSLTQINYNVHYDPVRVIHCSGTPPSINITILPLIDDKSIESIDSSPANQTFALPAHYYLNFEVATQPETLTDYNYGDTISGQGDYSIGIWADESHHERFAVDTALPGMQSDEYDEDYHKEKNIAYHSLAMDDRRILHTSYAHTTSTSIDSDIQPSIDAHHIIDSKLHVTDNTDYGYLTPNEFGIFRDPEGQAREMDGRILNISKEEIVEIIAMNGSSNFFNSKNRSEDPPSIDDATSISIERDIEPR
ncbi:hypothetical protein F2Q69_00059562 [Brassica cretica]|uniref:Uncharacterized protein n=1 Tax=Brassica cretica TaxID=69181 RepID=A0A8S9RC88_BRACR|nr:hypothetical protein F2Q69_00059562 [Brassica cretica]